MSLLNRYEKSRGSSTLTSDSAKTPSQYADRILKVNSFALAQVESPVNPTSLAPRPGDASYTQTVFEESVN